MADRDCKSKQTVKAKPPQPRYYTVGYVPNGGRRPPSPKLIISGKWLEALGFTPGQAVTVTSERGKMVITVDTQF